MGAGTERGESPSFDDWIRHCFDHPVPPGEVGWYLDSKEPECDLPDATIVEYLTRLFSAPLSELERYSDEQIRQGLWYIVGFSDTCRALQDLTIDEARRVACIESMGRLFSELFLPRCTNVLSTSSPSGMRFDGRWHKGAISPLNDVCYMWWDLLPLCGSPGQPEWRRCDDAVFGVLEGTLELPSAACQESALHGLGHWAIEYPERVATIVHRYLEQLPGDSPLREYARAAAVGRVL